MEDARRLLLAGRYEEAAEAFVGLETREPVQAALGRARSLTATGAAQDAETLLSKAFLASPAAAELPAELARLAFLRGDHATAKRLANQALALDEEQLTARWMVAELHRVCGRLDEAEDGYAWFIDYYNDHDELTAEQLRIVGLAAVKYARWKRNSAQFSFLVNELFPSALRLNENYWPAHLEMACLFAEKYNEGDAISQLSAALAINPNAAEAHVARAQIALQQFQLPIAQQHVRRALEINPNLLAAHQAQADMHLGLLDYGRAIQSLDAARELNPVDDGTLGRLAAAYGGRDGLGDLAVDSHCRQIIDEVVVRNRHCGEFFMTLADSLDRMRKYPDAARYYREADSRMPQLLYARGRLGLLLMRLGDERQASKLLEESFRVDPFNVRVKNMLEVLDVLDGYATIETDHFIVRFDAERDGVLGEYASRYLETIYPSMVEALGFEPPEKSLFEIFSAAKNTSGHGWFSARMVGLPFIGAVGACAGQVVAIASPTSMPKEFSWAHVLKHEFVHVVTLQQTDFNIPHWYTEALAVRHEQMPRPDAWNAALARRAREGDLFNLATINLGFIRPQDSEEWALAYCQAELYAEFMVQQYGPESLQSLLQAYRDNLKTSEAIRHCFGVDLAEFEANYGDYVGGIVEALDDHVERPHLDLDQLKQAVRDDPRSADRWAALAEHYLHVRDDGSARKCAIVARRLSEDHPLASRVLARLSLSAGERRQAKSLLRQSLDEFNPDADTLALLAALTEQDGDDEEAERLYRIGADRFPLSSQWLKSLSRIYLNLDERRKLACVLAQLAEMDGDHFAVRKQLLRLCADADDLENAVRWGVEAYQIDVMDAEVHATLADVYSRRQQYDRSAQEYATAIRLSPERAEWQIALAENFLRAGDKQRAIRTLEELLERRQPGRESAATLLERIRTEYKE